MAARYQRKPCVIAEKRVRDLRNWINHWEMKRNKLLPSATSERRDINAHLASLQDELRRIDSKFILQDDLRIAQERITRLESALLEVLDVFEGVDLWHALDGQFEGIEAAVRDVKTVFAPEGGNSNDS